MWFRRLHAAVVVQALVLAAPLSAQQPAPTAPPPSPVPAPQTAPPAAETVAEPQVLGRERPVPADVVPPPRDAPRAFVSIVSPQQSRVHKRSRGIRTQDGDGLVDGAAGDAVSGPTVERLP